MFFVVVLAEFRGCTTLAFLENTVEVRDVVEATGVANLDNGHGTVGKQARSVAQTYVDDVFGYALSRAKFEESAESRRRHRCQFRQGIQADFLAEILVDVLLYPTNPAAIHHVFRAREGAGGKQMILVALGKFIEQFEEFHHTIESRLHVHQLIEAAIDVHDGSHIKPYARGGVLKHQVDGL